ncbi:MAG: zinc ribbon domain-containing protein [Anaerolineae bacterium]|nr:zinc ribbon domain-containing protein [Anaerolineae bacterium]
MDEIRCPMCGKPNPAIAEICQYCQAQLKPLGRLGDEQPPEQPSPDWLDEVRSSSTLPFDESISEEISKPGGEEDIPGWLARIRQREREEQEALQGSEGLSFDTEAEELPDWTAGIIELEEKREEASGENWLERLRKSKAISEPGAPDDKLVQAAEEETTEPPQADEDNWMNQLKNFQSAEADAFEESFSSSPAAGQKEGGEGAEEFTAGAAEEDEFSSWLRALEEQVGPASPSENLPETAVSAFLGDVDHLTEQKLQAFESETGGPPEGEIPSWLAGNSSDESSRNAPTAPKEGETPDWLKAFAEPEAGSIPPSAPDEETPEWLEGFRAETLSSAEQVPLAEKPVWLETAEEKSETGEPAAGEESFEPPDWLKAFENLTEENVSQIGAPNETLPWSGASGSEGQDSGGGLQDWFSQLPLEEPGDQKEEELPASEPPGFGTEISSDDLQPEVQNLLPDELLPALESSAVFRIGGEEVELPEEATPFINQETSEWSSPGTAALVGAGENETEDLTPATLPGWLEAMRPVEAIVGGQAQKIDEEQIEISGPLAGLPGVLPPEDIIAQYRKPPVYSAKLQATERQRAQASILEELIRTAGKPQVLQKENPEAPRLLVRLGLAVILIFAILYPILFGPPTTETPGLGITTEILTFSNQVEALSPGQTVLLAVDYDAGYSGEMRFVAKGVIQRLIQKRLNLALLSTVPAGPVLAEDMLQRASSELLAAGALSAPLPPERAVNLGYLPGGLSSLQELALKPQQAIRYTFVSSYEAKPAWEHPALQGIAGLNDFAAVIVLTDSVETGRAWIEQTGARLSGVPLLLVTSAQAAPMLKPYASSGQVDGMLSGLMDGMAYERLAKTPGNAAAYWNAYRYGMYVMVAFLISGAILRTIVWLLSRRSKKLK